MSLAIKKLPQSTVEIEGEVPAEDFERYYQAALKELNEKSSIPGFRPGHIPEKILIEKISEGAVLEHAAERALEEEYPKILKEHKLDAIGHPRITITKIARKNPLGFKIETALLPEIKLPDYANIASGILTEKEEIKVEEKEVNEAVEYLKQSGKRRAESEKNEPEVDAPEINDEFAKKFGQPDLNSLKNALKNNILEDKKAKTRESRRMEIMDKISVSVLVEIPQILIDSEKEKMTAELRSSIENMGMNWEDYLKNIKKTEDELKKDWASDAEKRAKYALILREIANAEHIEPGDAELTDFVEKIAGQYPETERLKIDKSRLKDYAYGIIRNEKVFQFLESKTE